MRRALSSLLLTGIFVFGVAFPVSSSADDGVEVTSAQGKSSMIDHLFQQGGSDVANRILPYLKDRDLAVRSHAMKRLVDLGSRAVDPLIGALADEEVRWLASGALINIGDDSVPGVLLALKNRNPVIRRNALFILRQLDAVATAPDAWKALSDPDPSVQVQAIQTAAHFGGGAVLPLILAKVDSPVGAVRDAAVEALTKFGAESLPTLVSLLSYGNPEVRASAVRVLGAIGTNKGMAHLRNALTDASPAVRYYACVALGETADPSVVEDLVAHFDDPDPNVREAASEACSRMPGAAEPVLFRLLQEGNPLQKISAATTIRLARHRPAVPLLLSALHDPSRDVKVASVAALMMLAEPGSVEGLVNALRDPDIRWLCTLALRQFGDKNLRPLLRRDDDPELNYWKQHVLEAMGDRVLDGCLESLSKESDEATRIATLCTMRQIKDTRAVSSVIRLLDDERLGHVASFILSQMGEVAVEPLLLSLRDDSPSVRARSAAALGEIGVSRVVRPLRDLLFDKDPLVRNAAGNAIKRITGEALPPAPLLPIPAPDLP